ncbi:FecR family protein [Aestuariibaculum sediminum]|uniref:DUF4974 domain-containing protein n=1 Tax=Aestuariibaculum sediminum TaxID=2770637 RepID=A0A8J6Q3B3_9FLAO|nr:FecR family protein [Aestuariibaculum sediminum]MBD0833374.1 DUF4974 domain-containing protein [Aestuariibaculum sediminum]
MDQERVNILLIKLIERRITPRECQVLKEWIQTPSNLEYFQEFIKVNHFINSKQKFNSEKSFLRLKGQMLKDSHRAKRNLLRYAATILIFISAGLYFVVQNENQNNSQINNNEIIIGSDKATLTLEDGTVVDLTEEQPLSNDKMESNGKKIVYKSNNQKKDALVYNYLTVPRGGQFFVELSDGTNIWVNSDTQIKYPVSFIEGKDRNVELIYGEAYFDVSPSIEHQGSVFKVISEVQEVEVLGTEFNISAYKGDDEIYTTLVEGEVLISTGSEQVVLKPNDQALVKVGETGVYVNQIDTYLATSWKEGVFNFNDMPLDNIMKVLSRWYDVEVVFNKENMKYETFTGVFRKNQNLKDILNSIQTTNNMSYEIENKVINIK